MNDKDLKTGITSLYKANVSINTYTNETERVCVCVFYWVSKRNISILLLFDQIFSLMEKSQLLRLHHLKVQHLHQNSFLL